MKIRSKGELVNKRKTKAIEDLKNIVDSLEDAEEGAIISLLQPEIESLKIILKLLEEN
jgi:hypothetical protein